MPQSALASAAVRPWACAALLLGTSALVQAQMVPRPAHVATQFVQWIQSSAEAASDRLSPALQSLKDAPLWSQWTSRAGVRLESSLPQGRTAYALTLPKDHDTRIRSLHWLNDLPLSEDLRLTTGLVRGDLSAPWWSGDGGAGGALSVERLDPTGLGLFEQRDSLSSGMQPYLGAGYSVGREPTVDQPGWRLHADVGLVSPGTSQADRVGPLFKLNLRYGF